MAKNKQLVTPIGTLKFTETHLKDGEIEKKIMIPADYDEVADKGKITWKFALAFNAKEGAEIVKYLKDMEKTVKDRNFDIIKEDTSKVEGQPEGEKTKYEPNGDLLINFKSKFPPVIVDAAKMPIKSDVGFGSKARIVFVAKPVDFRNKVGVSCYGSTIQVTELSAANDLNILGDLDIPVTTDVPAEEVSWEE